MRRGGRWWFVPLAILVLTDGGAGAMDAAIAAARRAAAAGQPGGDAYALRHGDGYGRRSPPGRGGQQKPKRSPTKQMPPLPTTKRRAVTPAAGHTREVAGASRPFVAGAGPTMATPLRPTSVNLPNRTPLGSNSSSTNISSAAAPTPPPPTPAPSPACAGGTGPAPREPAPWVRRADAAVPAQAIREPGHDARYSSTFAPGEAVRRALAAPEEHDRSGYGLTYRFAPGGERWIHGDQRVVLVQPGCRALRPRSEFSRAWGGHTEDRPCLALLSGDNMIEVLSMCSGMYDPPIISESAAELLDPGYGTGSNAIAVADALAERLSLCCHPSRALAQNTTALVSCVRALICARREALAAGAGSIAAKTRVEVPVFLQTPQQPLGP